MGEDWRNYKDLVKFLKSLYHHDRQRFNIIIGKLSPKDQRNLLQVVKG